LPCLHLRWLILIEHLGSTLLLEDVAVCCTLMMQLHDR